MPTDVGPSAHDGGCSGHGAAVVRAGIRGLYTRLVVVHCGGVTPRADGPPGCPLQAGPSCTPPVGTAFHVPTEWPSAHPSAGVRLDRGGIRRQLIIANGLPHLVREHRQQHHGLVAVQVHGHARDGEACGLELNKTPPGARART